MKLFATCVLNGRLANNGYQICQLIAYALKYGLDYYIPEIATNGRHENYFKGKFPVLSNELKQQIKHKYFEPTYNPRKLGNDGTPSYHEIPYIENVCFEGFFQSHLYFDDYRTEILSAFALPYVRNKGIVAIHQRRQDYLTNKDFKPVTLEYIYKGINYFKQKGFTKFKVFSDDIEYCKQNYKFDGVEFEFSEGKIAMEDFIALSECDHQIISNSSFSCLASWFCQYHYKITVCPDDNHWFNGRNKDMLPESFIKIDF